MGKDKYPRRVGNEAMAKLGMLKTSPQKLNLVPGLIRGKKVEKALSDLTFSKKASAQGREEVLQSAIPNDENNLGLDVDEVIVAEAWVGKHLVLMLGRPARPWPARPHPEPFSELTIKVRQVGETAWMGHK